MRPCKQNLSNWRTCIQGWTIPKYSLYGNVNGTTYVCVYPRVNVHGNYSVQIWTGLFWKKVSTGYYKYQSIGHAIDNYIFSDDYVEHAPIFLFREDEYISRIVPHEKKPQAYYGYQSSRRARMYRQTQVDHALEHETVYAQSARDFIVALEDDRPLRFNPQRDGLKIKQTKCRPGKPFLVNTMPDR